MFESLERIGGHANTIRVDGVDVDTGFMVYNDLNYPFLIRFFESLGVEGEKTNMGFSVSMDSGAFEWCGDSLAALFATVKNIWNPQFYLMLWDVFRFNKEAKLFLALPPDNSNRRLSVGQFLRSKNFSDAFTKYYLVPMTSAIWSATAEGILSFPALTLFRFLDK